ncbi:MAG: type II toxin-antitoxin system Phd/YefM family antitoxin [Gemmatimonadetes bacterium]|nr:type II toxin-antitoxin system Phd/YefM family antitoxin [Gemmatimonadota bacterium]
MADTEPKKRASGKTDVSATHAQNNFGEVLGRVSGGQVVFITKYDRPAAVLMSIEEYQILTSTGAADLAALTREFDLMVERMQSPESAAATNRLFAMDPDSLGEAARDATAADDGS